MSLRSELKRLHKDIGATTVYVTHDQVEAMTLSDRILVLEDGLLQQADSPRKLYRYPANLFTAGFMGNPQANLVDGLVRKENGVLYFEAKEGDFTIPLGDKTEGLEPNKDLVVAIRPEDIQIGEGKDPDSMEMTIYSVLPAGSETIIYARRGKSIELVIKKPEEETRDLTMDQRIHVSFRALNFYDAKTEKLIASKG